jgi:hypothetical protein
MLWLWLLGEPDRALRAIEAFTTIRVTGLGLFGIHSLRGARSI